MAIDREIGNRSGEATHLTNLGDCYAALQEWDRARGYQREAIALADDIGFAQIQSEARLGLAKTQLFAGNLPAAQPSITDARDKPFPPTQPDIALVAGIIRLRKNDPADAAEAFREALSQAEQKLTATPGDYAALDTVALAHSGLALTDEPADAAQAIAAFHAARAATSAEGIVQGVLRLFDSLTTADHAGALHHVRTAAAGTRAT